MYVATSNIHIVRCLFYTARSTTAMCIVYIHWTSMWHWRSAIQTSGAQYVLQVYLAHKYTRDNVCSKRLKRFKRLKKKNNNNIRLDRRKIMRSLAKLSLIVVYDIKLTTLNCKLWRVSLFTWRTSNTMQNLCAFYRWNNKIHMKTWKIFIKYNFCTTLNKSGEWFGSFSKIKSMLIESAPCSSFNLHCLLFTDKIMFAHD